MGKRASKAPSADVGVGVGRAAPSEILCPHCGAQLTDTAVFCYGCGRGLTEGADLDERVERARGVLAANERDRDALYWLSTRIPRSTWPPSAFTIGKKGCERVTGVTRAAQVTAL